MVWILPLFFRSFGTTPRALTIGITFRVPRHSQLTSSICQPFPFFFISTLWSAGMTKFTCRLFFFFFKLVNLFVSQNPKEFYAYHSPRQIIDSAYIICLYCQILISCTILSGSLFPPNHAYSCISSASLLQFLMCCCFLIFFFFFSLIYKLQRCHLDLIPSICCRGRKQKERSHDFKNKVKIWKIY